MPLVEVKGLSKRFPIKKKWLTAVSDVSFDIHPGETLGLVGESGCGKSTTGRCLLRLEALTSGTVLFDGKDISSFSSDELQHFRREAQVIFQDPYASLNPRMTAGEIIAEPLLIHRLLSPQEIAQRVRELLDLVRLSKSSIGR